MFKNYIGFYLIKILFVHIYGDTLNCNVINDRYMLNFFFNSNLFVCYLDSVEEKYLSRNSTAALNPVPS